MPGLMHAVSSEPEACGGGMQGLAMPMKANCHACAGALWRFAGGSHVSSNVPDRLSKWMCSLLGEYSHGKCRGLPRFARLDYGD